MLILTQPEICHWHLSQRCCVVSPLVGGTNAKGGVTSSGISNSPKILKSNLTCLHNVRAIEWPMFQAAHSWRSTPIVRRGVSNNSTRRVLWRRIGTAEAPPSWSYRNKICASVHQSGVVDDMAQCRGLAGWWWLRQEWKLRFDKLMLVWLVVWPWPAGWLDGWLGAMCSMSDATPSVVSGVGWG